MVINVAPNPQGSKVKFQSSQKMKLTCTVLYTILLYIGGEFKLIKYPNKKKLKISGRKSI